MDEPQHGELVADEVQRVGHHHAVDRRQVERPVKSATSCRRTGPGKRPPSARACSRRADASRSTDQIVPAGPEEVRQGKREGAGPRSQVGPRRAASRHAVGDQADVIRVVHRVGVAIRIPQV